MDKHNIKISNEAILILIFIALLAIVVAVFLIGYLVKLYQIESEVENKSITDIGKDDIPSSNLTITNNTEQENSSDIVQTSPEDEDESAIISGTHKKGIYTDTKGISGLVITGDTVWNILQENSETVGIMLAILVIFIFVFHGLKKILKV